MIKRLVARCFKACATMNVAGVSTVSTRCLARPLCPHVAHGVPARPIQRSRWQHVLGVVPLAAHPGSVGARTIASAATAPELLAQLMGKLPQYCCGCGVKLQQTDPDAPGYFIIPKRVIEEFEQKGELLAGGAARPAAADAGQPPSSPEEAKRQRLDQQAEAWLEKQQRPANAGMAHAAAAAGEEEEDSTPAILCARCHSLTHYGRVKSEAAEGQLPEFDLAKKVGRKIQLQKDRRAVVLVVVDVFDFDGSLPRAALAALFPGSTTAPTDAEDLPFQLMVAVNKFDLLPSQATPRRVENWVRARLKQAGLPRPQRVYMVSAATGFGVKEMVRNLKDDMGFRADLWVVGAQNAGKSSLISAMKRLGGTGQQRAPTVAPVPGTTLGLLRVPGIPLGPKHRTFDTPGVHHPYQLTSHLNLQELGMVLPRKQLKPRTYRLGAGSSISIGGLAQVDVVSCPGATLYLTVFVADAIVTHMGKTLGAEERRQKHVGGLLVPPVEPERLQELGPWEPRRVQLEGDSWARHSKDVAVAGLGWIAVGVQGAAELCISTTEGVSVTVHDALIPDFAKDFQRPGFSKILPNTKQKQLPAGSDSKAGVKPSRRKAADSADTDSSDEEQDSDSSDNQAAAAEAAVPAPASAPAAAAVSAPAAASAPAASDSSQGGGVRRGRPRKQVPANSTSGAKKVVQRRPRRAASKGAQSSP